MAAIGAYPASANAALYSTPQAAAALTVAVVQAQVQNAMQTACAGPLLVQGPPFMVSQCVPRGVSAQQSTPPSLTAGMVDPAVVEQQKIGYIQDLESQLEQYMSELNAQKKEHLEAIHRQDEELNRQLHLQLQQRLKQQVIGLERKYNAQVLLLNQQYTEQKAALEQEALQLTGDYQKRKLDEHAMKMQLQLQKERAESEQRFAAEMQKLQQQQPRVVLAVQGPSDQGIVGPCVPLLPMQAPQGSYVPPPGVVSQGQPAVAGSYTPPVNTQVPHSSYVPPVPPTFVMQMPQAPKGSYVPPPFNSYVPPVAGHLHHVENAVPSGVAGCYAPPANAQGPHRSYVPLGCGSYVEPPASMQMLPVSNVPHAGSTVSYVPPAGNNGSYVPPPTTQYQGSSVVTQAPLPYSAPSGMCEVPTVPVLPYNEHCF
jgi:hypothetical protein